MDINTPIATLSPELPELESKHIRAVVSLLWPYSSLTRQFALLLAEPDFRLRRKRGQVRVRFCGPSAKAIAETGVGIGDEVVLELQGAQFVQEETDTIQTPGRSIDWELSFSRTLVVQVFRKDIKISNLEIINASPIPKPTLSRDNTPITPLRGSALRPRDSQQWSSPAFLKRGRISEGPVFDTLTEGLDDDDEHDKKRRRKSYRDWNTWKYAARTPSPEKEDIQTMVPPILSPTGPIQPHDAPLSPPKTDKEGRVSENQSPTSEVQDVQNPPTLKDLDDFVRDTDYYDLYAGPDEHPPPDALNVYGGTTVLDTEDEVDHDTQQLKVLDSPPRDTSSPQAETYVGNDDMGFENNEEQNEVPQIQVFMPAPALPTLQTNFAPSAAVGMLTPIGREPSSPIIKPLDSATLPMPSPFPGERDGESTSFLDLFNPGNEVLLEPSVAVLDQDQQQELAPLAQPIDHIEPDFYSSVSSANAPAFHSTHESAFTDLRFTFGLDGSMFSRHKEPSQSPEPTRLENQGPEFIERDFAQEPVVPGSPQSESHPRNRDLFDEFTTDQSTESSESVSFPLDAEPVAPLSATQSEIVALSSDASNESASREAEPQPEIVMLSSDSDVASVSSEADTESDDQSVEDEANFFRARDFSYRKGLGEPNDTESVEESDDSENVDTDDDEVMEFDDSEDVESVDDLSVISDDPQIERSRDDSIGHVTAPETFHSRSDASGIPADHLEPGLADQGSDFEVAVHENVQPKATNIIDLGSGSEDDSEDDLPYSNVAELMMAQRNLQLNTEVEPTEAKTQIERKPDGFESLITQEEDPAAPAIQDDNIYQDTAQTIDASRLSPDTLPDVKMESVEEDSLFLLQTQSEVDKQHHDSSDSEAELTIAVPAEGHKIGEMEFQKVANTAPARNTRSKTKETKVSLSPAKDKTSTPEPKFRGARLRTRASLEPAMGTSLSPTKTLGRSTASPGKGTHMPTSPYSLRSRSKQLTPTPQKPSRNSARGRGRGRGSLDTFSPSPADSTVPARQLSMFASIDNSPSIFQPSQELGASQSRFVGLQYVKDSEEGSLYSENSLSTNQNSDGLVPPNIQIGISSRNSYKPVGSPQKRHNVYDLPSDPENADIEEESGATPKASQRVRDFVYPELISESANHSDYPSSPPAPVHNELNDPTIGSKIQDYSLENSNMPLTPQATQASLTGISGGIPVHQVDNTMPMTPQPTQVSTTGAGAHELANDNVAFRPRSPSVHSEDISDVETETQIAKAHELPSIKGLPTALSYYTPLVDLSFFLNRSSQFHSSENPDTLVLVTSSNTSPQRATKGPKHWNTTLHVTDRSIFPEIRTVQVFRPYDSALPVADKGDVILLRGFLVKSLNHIPMLISGDESAWCVWRWGKPIWGTRKIPFGQIRAREEVKGPDVERGEGEWKEVERLRTWWVGTVKSILEDADKVQQNGDAEKVDAAVGDEED